MKQCCNCHKELSLDNFHVARSRPDGKTGICKDCAKRRASEWQINNKEKVREAARLRRLGIRQKKTEATLYADLHQKHNTGITKTENYNHHRQVKWFYGIDREQLNDMLLNQGGLCAICLCQLEIGPKKTYHVDHNHTTGKVRGLLCPGCNLGLGAFRENPFKLRQAARYIEENT